MLLTCVVLCFAVAGLAQKPSPPLPGGATIPLARIPRVTKPPKLEDFLENQPREAELTVDDFRQNVPGDGTPATEETTAYLSYDDKNLYVVFVCHDNGQVRAHLSKREDVDQDDGVGVLLDTFRDHHRAYVFYSNPLGIQQDSIYTEGQTYDYRGSELVVTYRSLPCVRCAASHKLLFRCFEHSNVMSGIVSTTSLPQACKTSPEARSQGVICRIASQRRLQAWRDFCRRG